jgi:peptide deformylase
MSQILPLVLHPDPRLRQPSKPINPAEIAALGALWRDMAETMIADQGIGLAAPQIGKNIRLIIVNTNDGPIAMFNPVLLKKSLLKEWGEEGCLSIPKVFGDVKRHKSVRCQFITPEGKERTIDASGLMARVIQHEIDHLDGILFIDTARNIHTIE